MQRSWLSLVIGMLAVVVLAIGALSVAPAAQASIITVCASGCDHATIQAAVDAASSGDVISVSAGTYVESVNVNKALSLIGAGASSTTIQGPIGGDSATVRVAASNVTIAGFTITRLGNNPVDWNNPGLKSAGIAVQSAHTGMTVRDNILTGNRTAIDINNSSGHTIRNNDITFNRTGLLFRNQTDNMTVVENKITNNWTVGVLFLDASGGTNSPVQTALNSEFRNNDLSGNWYGQIVDRQSGGSLPTPGTTNLKNFSGNWYGSTAPVVSIANSAEPGYSTQIPVAYGGSATPPGGQPDILGPASANFDFTPYLNSGTDTDVETTSGRGTNGFQGDFSNLWVTAAGAQVGVTGRIQEGVNLVTASTVNVVDGTYEEAVVIDNKTVTLKGQSLAAIVKAPVTVPTCTTTSYDWHPVICAKNNATATIDTLTVDGAGRGNGNYRFMGVAFRNAGGAVKNSVIDNIEETPFSGTQHGVGINLYNNDAASRTLDVLNNDISDFQKNGMAINTGGSSILAVNIDGNDVQGKGVTTVTAQNGIQVYQSGGSLTGTITDNTIAGIGYDNTSDPTKWVATSILDFYADVDITGNTVTGAQVGVYFIDASGDILDNDITVNQIGNGGMWGIIATDPPDAVPSPFGVEEMAEASSAGPEAINSTLVVNVSDNTVTFSGGDNTSTFGIEADGGYGPNDIAFTANNNLVTGFEVGIEFYQCQSSCSTGIVTSASAFDNSVAGNDIGMRSNLSNLTVDASGNWWGSNVPATVAGLVSGDIDYTPWLNAGTNSASGNGFEGDFSNLWVDDDSPQTGSTPRIQEGIDLVTASVVNVAAGSYPAPVNVNKSVDLRGAQYNVAVSGRTAGGPSESTIQGLVTVAASNVTIDGFTLTNPNQPYAATVSSGSSSVAISHNMVDDVGDSSFGSNVHSIAVSQGPDSVTIADNSFSNISANNKSVSAVGILDSLSVNPSTGLIIRDNTFSNIASATKGAYGVIINNAAGAPGAQIFDNTFTSLSGGWTHAIGLEGPTLNAFVTGNVFSGLTATGADNSAVFFEKNPNGGTVTVQCNQFNGAAFYGVAIHPNDLPGGSNGYNYVVTAEDNWWNDASGPYHPIANPTGTGALVGTNVDFDPWLTSNVNCTSGTGNWLNVTTSVYDDLQDSLDNASPGDIIRAVGTSPLAGGATANTAGVIIDLNGKTAGPGSPFLTVNADDVTVNGPGVLDGNGSASPAILVNAGADNFILDGVEIREWTDGVHVAGLADDDIESLKLVNNWIHSNTEDGLQVDKRVAGVVTIEGNLFKVNTGFGVSYGGTGTLDAEYNSWGADQGPTAPGGDGVGANVDYDPWTFAEVYLDVDPITGGDQYVRGVNESASFNVDLNVDGENLYGVSFRFTYDPNYLTFNGPPTFVGPWVSQCAPVGSPPTGTFAYTCHLTGGSAWDGGTVATFNFTANGPLLTGDGPWSTTFDISHLVANTNAGAQGGVKVFVNNAGFNAPSTGDRDITDANDGQINITGIAKFTGFVDLQGRPNDSGAVVEVYNQLNTSGATLLASGTSVSSGKYTTNYVGLNLLTVGTTYYFQVDRALYLPTTVKNPSLAATWAQSKLMTVRPLTSLATLVLLGGDGTNDDKIDINDGTCIGNAYGNPPVVCNGTGSSDVNGDGTTSILDLVLFGGNYGATSSPWTP